MSVYTAAAEAYRDTTKWLTAFLPVATVFSGGLLVGPGVVRSVHSSESIGDWLKLNWLLLICGAVIAAAVAGIIWRAAVVLAVEPKDIGQMASGTDVVALSEAIGNGAAAPYFFDTAAFKAAMADLANAWDNNAVVADDPRLARTVPAVEALREWSVLDQIKQPFKIFGIVFVAGTALVASSIAISAAVTSAAGQITTPTAVAVSVSDSASSGFVAATGCVDTERNTYTAVSGTWDLPRLEVDGDGCRFAATWTPKPGQFELRPVKE